MKPILLLSFLIHCCCCMGQSRVVAQVSNFESNKGVCRACIFSSESSFNGAGGNPVQCVTTVIGEKKTLVVFNNIPPGSYAVFLFHDTNKNNKMDKNFLGIPREGYGSSKNNLPFAAAPTFEANKFQVSPNSVIQLHIRLRNLY